MATVEGRTISKGGLGTMNCTNGDKESDSFSDSLSSKATMVLHSVVLTKTDKSNCVKNEKRNLEREVKILHTFLLLHI